MAGDLREVDILTRYRAARRRVLPDLLTSDERADLLVAVLWPTPVMNGNGHTTSPGIWVFTQMVLFGGEDGR